MKLSIPSIKIFLILIIILSVGSGFGQSSEISTEEQLKEDVELAPCKSKDRMAEVKKLFVKMGAKESDISTEKFQEGENLLVKLKGSTAETIIVGAHYDKVVAGCGAIDNWTGIVILANLYKTISQFSTNKSYIFVAFDKEEAGLLGSKAMVKAIPKENYAQYCSMVNMDSFGFAAPQAPSNMSNAKMIRLAKDTAKKMQFTLADSVIENEDADSSSFQAKKIPAITFDGLSNNWQKFLHTDNDKISNINMESVSLGYRFVLTYITKIENLECGEFK